MAVEPSEVLTIWMDSSGCWTGSLTCTTRTLYGLSAYTVRERARMYVDHCYPDRPPGSVTVVERLRFRGIEELDMSCLKLDGHPPEPPLSVDRLATARRVVESIAALHLPLHAEALACWSGMRFGDVEEILRAARVARFPLRKSDGEHPAPAPARRPAVPLQEAL